MKHDPLRYVYLETTNYCNLKCTFCNREEVVDKLIHMPLEKWDRVLDKLKDHPIEEAKLMGLGEPFMHPKFSKICKMFKDYFPDSRLIVATNAQYKLNDNFKESLNYIDLLYISIDGYKDSYEKYRPPAKWKKLINFLTNLKAVDRKNCKITCNYVVNKENIIDIKKIEELCEEYNLEELRLNIAQDWSEGSKLDHNIEVSGYSKDQIKYLKENFQTNIKGKAPWNYSDCFWVKDGLYMTASGDVKVCCLNTDTKSIGNIFRDELKFILNSEKINQIREGCINNEPTEHCKNCSYKELSPLLNEILN
tara:strand:+ start:751 stop:1671 length:921 start_codon:yes stop_codon:yes gene_type:complete